jgi:peptide/nickel transport system substrate-binding protein
MERMNRKVLFAILLSALMLTITLPIVAVHGAGIPNPDNIIVATFGGPETVDPAWAYDTASAELIQNVYEPLCAFDGESTTNYVAKLADWWPGYDTNPGHAITPSLPDPSAPAGTNQTWYFHIRPNVKFHDGSILTPADVEYSFERGLLMDHSGGPMWMIYEPLLGVMGSSAYDVNENGKIDESEYNALDTAIDKAIQSNATHVWFNLPAPYAPFQQILTQSWGMILSKNYAIAHGCWNGQHGNYTEFLRTYDPPTPGPLMDPAPEAMGTGPYKLSAMNTDPHTGWYVLERFDDYWGGPAPTKYATVKNVEEWSNRKAQFFSTDPALQADFCAVNRANIREMHINGDKDGPTYPGFRMYKVPVQSIGAVYFVYNVSQPSDYTPVLGTTPKPDLFMDRNMRLVFMYALNVSKYLAEYWLGEAQQPTTCMPPGTAFYNESKPVRNGNTDADLVKAQAALDAAWGGQAKAQGITVKVTYNAGNTARETIAKMLEDVIEHRLSWASGAHVDIVPTGVPWSSYLVDMYTKKLSVFIIGWLADYPDPHDWFMPFMHSEGDYSGTSQGVIYGLGNIAASWPSGPSYGPPPYTNYLGETVTSINNTYVDHMIEVALGLPPAGREAVYNELMDIFYAEAATLPVYFSYGRHYERTWISGWYGTWNSNPISPGLYFYTISKVPPATLYTVDVNTYSAELSPVSNISIWLLNQGANVSITPAMKKSPTGSTSPIANMTAYVKRNDAGPQPTLVLVLAIWSGVTASGHREEFGYAYDYLAPGAEAHLGPTNISNAMPAVGQYEVYVNTYVLSDYAINGRNQTQADFHSGYFYALGYCDINKDNLVDVTDYQLVKKAAGTMPGQAKWNWAADVNCDNMVDVSDYQLIKRNIPKSYTPS